MYHVNTAEIVYKILTEDPRAYANMLGGYQYPQLYGTVLFYGYRNGTIVVADITGLPCQTDPCKGKFFGFHIHEGKSCAVDEKGQFSQTLGHYNPGNCEHPYHAGDMPALMGNQGKAWSAFYTDRFMPEGIIGKTVVIHDMPDDYKTQPSGNSGEKIGCGVIH